MCAGAHAAHTRRWRAQARVLLRLDPKVAEGWSDEEVARRWGRHFPPRDKSRQPLPISDACVQDRFWDPAAAAQTCSFRSRIQF
jgi:hypothetical protein